MTIRLPFFFIIAIAIISLGRLFNPGYGIIGGYWVGIIAYALVIHEFATFQAISHFKKIQKGEWITHWKANIGRLMFIVGLPFLYHAYNYDITKIIQLIIFGFPYFGLLFNLKLNKLRGLKWDYVGINDKKDAITDKIFSKIPHGGKVLFVLELITTIIFIYLYI